MRRLDRSKVQEPPCLSRYRAGHNDWSALATVDGDYREVCARLDELQEARCAYCESDLRRENHPHVEHFAQRSRAPALTFAWENLFRSCTQQDHCGTHKDTLVGSYVHADLLKPDVDDPRVFLAFSSNGSIYPRDDATEAARHRATETIRVFGLDCQRLRGLRRAYLKAVLSEVTEAVRAELSGDEMAEYLKGIAAAYEAYPFRAAVLDLLGM